MTITVQALQKDGTWATRSAFTTENAKVRAGSMAATELEALARATMSKWQQTSCDGKQLRVHNTDSDAKATSVNHAAFDTAADVAYHYHGTLPSYEDALRDPAKARILLTASKGGGVRGITEDHRFELAEAVNAARTA